MLICYTAIIQLWTNVLNTSWTFPCPKYLPEQPLVEIIIKKVSLYCIYLNLLKLHKCH